MASADYDEEESWYQLVFCVDSSDVNESVEVEDRWIPLNVSQRV